MVVLHRMAVAILVAFGVLTLPLATASADTNENIAAPRPDVEALLMKGAFDDLEKIATDERSSRARTHGGAWLIEHFYLDLTAIGHDDCACGGRGSTYSFDGKRKSLESWLAAKPDSMTPRIALAELWANYAWQGRGGETGDEQWKAFNDGMTHALDLLRPVDPNADPQVYYLELQATPVYDEPRKKLDEIYARAVRAFPNFPDYATTRFNYLLERWYGEPGEAAAFTKTLLTTPGGDEGLIAYFSVARVFLGVERNFSVLFDGSGVAYPTLAKAFAVRSATVGVSNADVNVLMYYAVAALDKKTAAMLAKKIGDKWEPSVWTEKKYYDAAVTWTNQWF